MNHNMLYEKNGAFKQIVKIKIRIKSAPNIFIVSLDN